MEAPKLLLETLEGLSRRDFNKFKWYLGLKMLKSCRKIPLSHLRSPHPHDTVSKMLESYGEEMAVNIAAAILKKMKHNDTAEELQKAHTEGAAAQKKVSHALPRSSSALALPTDQKTSSDGAAGASTPRPINHTNGSKNITDGAAAQEKVSHALVKSLSALALLGGQTSFTDGEGGGNTPRPINAINGRINFFGGYCGVKTTNSSTSSPAVAPPAAPAMSAQHGSVIIARKVAVCISGTCDLTKKTHTVYAHVGVSAGITELSTIFPNDKEEEALSIDQASGALQFLSAFSDYWSSGHLG